MHFPRANAVLAIHEHPKRREPFVESDWRVFEDRSSLERELAALMMASALPSVVLLRELHVVTAATGTPHLAVRPHTTDKILAAVRGIGEVLNCFLKCLRFHARKDKLGRVELSSILLPLASNYEVIYGAQQLTGKILDLKHLARNLREDACGRYPPFGTGSCFEVF